MSKLRRFLGAVGRDICATSRYRGLVTVVLRERVIVNALVRRYI